MRAPDFYATIARHIAEAGRALISTADEADHLFTYTIGNWLVGTPELIVCGLAPRDAQFILNAASRLPEAIAAGTVDLGGQFPLRAVPCAPWARTTYAIQAGRYLMDDTFDLVQLLAPDPAGRYPGEPGCEARFANVPALWREVG